MDGALCRPSEMGDAVVKVVEDADSHGRILEVWPQKMGYRRRLVVDDDGVSNPVWSDETLKPQIAYWTHPAK
jgi:hypothetical protein